MIPIILVLGFAHFVMTMILLDAVNQQYGENYIKNNKIVLWIPIINYIFVLSKEIIRWFKDYRENLKNL